MGMLIIAYPNENVTTNMNFTYQVVPKSYGVPSSAFMNTLISVIAVPVGLVLLGIAGHSIHQNKKN